MGGNNDECYGIVIDAGSSGSRIHVFRWQDPESLVGKSENEQLVRSVPQIYQDEDWTFKVSPGLSTFGDKPHKAFSNHVKPLLDFAEHIIPEGKVKDTPIFIQATAGMRLLPKKKKDKILENLCSEVKHSTNFLLQDCDSQIEVIDGETEGLYGWLALNYLFGHFNGYDPAKVEHFTFGFMDMGGASTQIAFAPSNSEEVVKHRDDIATIYLKNVNGDVQEWDVFVSTWLGFGANQARKRYLTQLINSLPENSNNYDDDDYNTRELTDPCLPKKCKTKFEFKSKDFKVTGSGDYEQCLKSIYPLLLKNLPCIEEPCLFNGVHAPQIDFYKDKFVGTSEYWYTANDVFKLGGTYNFEQFSDHVKEFCNTDWSTIMANSEKGLYNSIPNDMLMDSCFKANWVLNVLHEGFGLPRAGIDDIDNVKDNSNHPLFQSADSIKDRELSWTLGRILLYASGNIQSGKSDQKVGVQPSSNEATLLGKTFIEGALVTAGSSQRSMTGLYRIMILVAAIILWFTFMRKFTLKGIKNLANTLTSRASRFKYLKLQTDPQSELEEGTFQKSGDHINISDREGFKFRSKSMFNLNDERSRSGSSYPMRVMEASPLSNQSVQVLPSSAPPHPSKMLRPAFSLSDFSKFKDSKLDD